MEPENARDETHPQSYMDQVKKHLPHNQALSRLVDFLQSSQKYTPPRLAVLEFFSDRVQLHPHEFSVSSLNKYWQDNHSGNASNNTNTTGGECKGRLYILEDLSSDYISALSSHFDLDPMLFVRHLFTPVYSQTDENELERQPPWMLQSLFSTQAESEAQTLLYYEIRELGGIEREELSIKEFRWETCANVARRVVQIDRDRESKPRLVRRNLTFWSRRNEGSGPWDGKLRTRLAAYPPLRFLVHATVFLRRLGLIVSQL
jgi:hypothetical protein